jgi:hypothetical protein
VDRNFRGVKWKRETPGNVTVPVTGGLGHGNRAALDKLDHLLEEGPSGLADGSEMGSQEKRKGQGEVCVLF